MWLATASPQSKISSLLGSRESDLMEEAQKLLTHKIYQNVHLKDERIGLERASELMEMAVKPAAIFWNPGYNETIQESLILGS